MFTCVCFLSPTKQNPKHTPSREARHITVGRVHPLIWSRETGSAVPSRVSLLISILRLDLVLTYGIPPEYRGGVHLFILTVIRHRVSPEFVGSRNCVPMAFTAKSPPAQGQ